MRKVVAIALSLIITTLVVIGVAYGTNRPAEASPQAQNVAVCPLPPLVCATVTVSVPLPGLTVTLPRRTITVLQPQTVRLPPITVTEIVRVPRVTQTIIRPPVTLKGPVRARTATVTRPGLPGATTTATVVVNREIIRNGTAPPVTREVRSTISGQATVTSDKVVPSKEVVRLPGTTKTVTKLKAVGISLLALLALMGLGWLLLWLGFILGYKRADKENTTFLRALRDTIHRRPGKHE